MEEETPQNQKINPNLSLDEKRIEVRRINLLDKIKGISRGALTLAALGTIISSQPSVEKEKKETNLNTHLPSRKGFEPRIVLREENSGVPPATVHSGEMPHVEPIPAPVPKSLDINEIKPEKIFMHEVEDGDTLWKILEDAFEGDKVLETLTEAQKIYFLNQIAGIIFKNPKNFGLDESGVLKVGDKINLNEFNTEPEEIKRIAQESKEIILPGSAKEKETLNLITKSPKPEPEVVPEPISEPISELIPEPIPKVLDEDQLHQEIAEAKQKIAELENQTRNPNLERTLASDSKSYISDIKFNQQLESAFKSEIDGIYGHRGLLGLGGVVGTSSKEWVEMAKLPASKVLEYYMGDSAKSGLSPEIVKQLIKSKNHAALMKQVAGLMEKTNGNIKPFQNNESMEQFIKRLGGYILRNNESR